MEIQWPLVFFSLLAGCGGCLAAFVGISEFLGKAEKIRKNGMIVALVLVVVGGCASLLHLAQPGNIMAAATNIFSLSGISVELIALGATAILIAVYLIAITREKSSITSKIIGALVVVFGILLGFATGNGYVIAGQPNWNTILLPLAYLSSDLVLASFVFIALMSALGDEDALDKRFPLAALVLVGVQLIVFIAYGAFLSFEADTVAFWLCAIIVGSIATAILCFLLWRKQPTPAIIPVGLCCSVVGALGIRAAMWLVGTGYLNLFGLSASGAIL